MASIAESVGQVLQSLGLRDRSVCVALSGGVDSVVLLDVLHRLAPELRLTLSALHVNHGLSPHAARWEAFSRALCEQRSVAFCTVSVAVPRNGGAGPEAAARRARYAVFARVRADYLALGHHLDDQAETLLLQLLRGAGPKGLSAMSVTRALPAEPGSPRPPILLRPLLGITRERILAHARLRGLSWVEDESNRDTVLDRNFLRHRLLPLVGERFPAWRETLARAARNLADAAAIADALGEIDLRSAGDAGGVRVEALRGLPIERALNVLRVLFANRGLPPPPRARLEEALRQCLDAAADARVCVAFGAVDVRRHRGRVRLVARRAAGKDWSHTWRGEDAMDLPDGLGRLRFVRTTGEGIAQARCERQTVTVRLRRGGETFLPDPGRVRRALKKLLQEAGVPAWERGRLPLVFCGEVLAWVPGLGVAADHRPGAGEPGVRIEWETMADG
ncbi:MAG TPA: tRNA lysidine(34) synthetase TilS [Burkholderiales bacterium]|nr:tRNA lysidine(34) synthetase TilS [Burkholderiales bacterium]